MHMRVDEAWKNQLPGSIDYFNSGRSRDILPKAMAANPHKGTDIRPNRDMSNNNSRTTKVRFS